MGLHGFNAGGYAYMEWVQCRLCGRKFPIGKHNERRECSNKITCQKRRAKQVTKETKIVAGIKTKPKATVRMDDYLGAIVQIKRDLRTGGGRLCPTGIRLWPAGTTFIVHSHWRGKLTLCERDGKTLGGEGPLAIRQVSLCDIRVLADRLA